MVTFLTDCSLVDSVSGGGGGGSDSLYIKTTSVADETTTYKIMLDNGTTKDSIIVEDSHPQLTVTTATLDDLRTYSIKQNGTTKGTITVNLEAVDTSHVAQMISDSMAALGGGGDYVGLTGNDTILGTKIFGKVDSIYTRITPYSFYMKNDIDFPDRTINMSTEEGFTFAATGKFVGVAPDGIQITRGGYSATGPTKLFRST